MKTIVAGALGPIILLAAISAGSLFFRLGSLPLSGSDEPRYARIAIEMRDQGQWVTPTLQGLPWLEKPPLYYWITIPFLSIFNSAETAARAGSAVCALVSALAVFYLGSVLWTRPAGLLAGSILLTSLGFIGFGRSASTDMPFTCCFTLAMVFFAAALKEAGFGKIVLAYAFLGLAVLGKGPVAVILAAGIGLIFWFLDEKGIALRRWHLLTGCAIVAAVSLPWFWLAFRQNGYSFISTFFINHNIARYVSGIHHHSQPFYYYVPVLFVLLFPWSGWMIFLFSRSPVKELRRRREWNPAMLFLFCWALFPVAFFSFSGSKLAGYILPSLPPVAMIIGARFSRLIDGNTENPKLRICMILSLLFSAAFAVAAPVFFQREYANFRVGLLLGAAILAPALIAFGIGRRGDRIGYFHSTLFQGLVVIIVTVQFAFPVLGPYLSTREIALEAMGIRKEKEPVVTYDFFQHSLNFYTRYSIAAELHDPESMRHFARDYPSALVVTDVRGFRNIQTIRGLSWNLLGKQGDVRLLRVVRNPSRRLSEHGTATPARGAPKHMKLVVPCQA